MAVCPTKNLDRYEWFAEKATELGLDEIVPVIGEHSERRVFKPERLRRILLSASKQSLKGAIPSVAEPLSVKEFIRASSPDDLRLICCCFEGEVPRLSINDVLPAGLVRSGACIGEQERPLSGNAPLNPSPAPQSPASNARYRLAWNVVAEDGSVGIRIPLPGFWRDLVALLGRPLVSTSANLSGEPTPKRFAEITEEIRAAVDYCVPASLERGSTGSASQIIKVGLGGEVEIIRP